MTSARVVWKLPPGNWDGLQIWQAYPGQTDSQFGENVPPSLEAAVRTGLRAGSTVRFAVRVNLGGKSSPLSEVTTVNLADALGVPTGIGATRLSSTQAHLRWSASEGTFESYKIWQKTANDPEFVLAENVMGSNTAALRDGLPSNQRVEFAVRSVAGSARGPLSNVAVIDGVVIVDPGCSFAADMEGSWVLPQDGDEVTTGKAVPLQLVTDDLGDSETPRAVGSWEVLEIPAKLLVSPVAEKLATDGTFEDLPAAKYLKIEDFCDALPDGVTRLGEVVTPNADGDGLKGELRNLAVGHHVLLARGKTPAGEVVFSPLIRLDVVEASVGGCGSGVDLTIKPPTNVVGGSCTMAPYLRLESYLEGDDPPSAGVGFKMAAEFLDSNDNSVGSRFSELEVLDIPFDLLRPAVPEPGLGQSDEWDASKHLDLTKLCRPDRGGAKVLVGLRGPFTDDPRPSLPVPGLGEGRHVLLVVGTTDSGEKVSGALHVFSSIEQVIADPAPRLRRLGAIRDGFVVENVSPGKKVMLQRTSDLVHWEAVLTRVLETHEEAWVDPDSDGFAGAGFWAYRIRFE